MGDNSNAAAFDRMKNKVRRTKRPRRPTRTWARDDVNEKFAAMEKQEEIDRLLHEIKSKRNA